MIHFGRSVDFGKLLVASFAQQHGASVIEALKISMVWVKTKHTVVLCSFSRKSNLAHFKRQNRHKNPHKIVTVFSLFFHIFNFQMSRSSYRLFGIGNLGSAWAPTAHQPTETALNQFEGCAFPSHNGPCRCHRVSEQPRWLHHVLYSCCLPAE